MVEIQTPSGPRYLGPYRAVIEDIDDPEERKRYRVRVFDVHRDEQPINTLPWAEFCVFAGKGFGDIPHFDAGDNVFVEFEKGDRRWPIIIGGWLSYVGGTNDLPTEQTGDYAETQQRWMRIDRANQLIEMDPTPGETKIRIRSGEAQIEIRQDDGAVEIVCDTRIIAKAPQVQVLDTTEVFVDSGKVFVSVDDEATVVSEDALNLRAANQISIGRYEDELTGALTPKTSDVVDVRADSSLKLESGNTLDVDAAGQADVDVVGPFNVTGQADANLRSTADFLVHSDSKVRVDAPEVEIVSTGTTVTIDAASDVVVNAANDVSVVGAGSVSVEATGNAVSITAGANCTIDAGANCTIDAAGSATVTVTGLMRVESDTRIELEAPTIDLTATAQLSIDGGTTTTIDGSVVLIG